MGAIDNDISTAVSSPSADFRALPSFRLHRLARLIEREGEAEYLRLFGLRMVECRIVGLAGAPGGTTLKQLTEELELDKAHGSRLVARLVARGLVGRLDNPADARSPSLRATAAGLRLRAEIFTAAQARNSALLSVLPAAESAAWLASLDRLTAGLRGWLPHPEAAPRDGGGDPPVALDRALARALHHALTAALEIPPS